MTVDRIDKADVVALPPSLAVAVLAIGALPQVVWPISLRRRLLARRGADRRFDRDPRVGRSGTRAGEDRLRRPQTDDRDRRERRFRLQPHLGYSGIAACANSAWIALLAPALAALLQKGVIEPEERYLERKFGEDYLRYKGRVRRWI